MNPISGTYREITWTSFRDLSQKLGCNVSAATNYVNRDNHTIEDFIDFRLGHLTYEEYCKNGFTKKQPATYRGITFVSPEDLSKKLLVAVTSARHWLSRHPHHCITEYIDFQLKDSTYEEYLQNNGVGYFRHNGYVYKNISELANLLKCGKSSICGWIRQHPGTTEKEYIDYYFHTPTHKGIPCKTQSDVAEALGVSKQAVNQWLQYNSTKTLKDYIDYYFKKHPEKECNSEDVTTEDATLEEEFPVSFSRGI